MRHMGEMAALDEAETNHERLAVVAWMRLARLSARLQRALDQQTRTFGLSLAQFDVLAQVGAREGMSQQELAHRLLVTRANVTQLLERMASLELIERRPSGTGRAVRLHLTPRGRMLHDRLVPAHEGAVAELLSGLSTDELRVLTPLLHTLDRSVRLRTSLGEDKTA
jgi:DNA-binding MarR family transcriptional regulator